FAGGACVRGAGLTSSMEPTLGRARRRSSGRDRRGPFRKKKRPKRRAGDALLRARKSAPLARRVMTRKRTSPRLFQRRLRRGGCFTPGGGYAGGVRRVLLNTAPLSSRAFGF